MPQEGGERYRSWRIFRTSKIYLYASCDMKEGEHRMNMWIERSELDEVKAKLAEWARKIPETYESDQKIIGEITEQEFFTVVKRVVNLEIQNKENAKLKLSDFKIGDILLYLMENEEVQAVLHVDSSNEYDIRTNFSHIHGSGKEQVIIIR